MTVRDIYEVIDRLAPFSLAMEWDNCGLQVGDWRSDVDKILVALDATPSVISEAAEKGCQLVVTHHPLLFNPVRQIVASSPAYLAVRSGLSVISAHTNYDLAPQGVNTQLAAAVGLTDLTLLPTVGNEPAIGLVGTLPQPMTASEFGRHLAKVLGVTPRYNPLEKTITRVALCGGSGGDQVAAGQAAGCDAFLTGEARHHEFLAAHAMGVVMFDGTHYATEALAMPYMADYLRDNCPGVYVEMATAYDGAVLG